MKRLGLPLLLALSAALSGCKSEPANPLLGNWTSTTPANAEGAAGCPSHYTFTVDTQTVTISGLNTPIPVTYEVQPKLVVVKMKYRSVGFKFTTPDAVAWTDGPCAYKRD